jgi:hypothetical protein
MFSWILSVLAALGLLGSGPAQRPGKSGPQTGSTQAPAQNPGPTAQDCTRTDGQPVPPSGPPLSCH